MRWKIHKLLSSLATIILLITMLTVVSCNTRLPEHTQNEEDKEEFKVSTPYSGVIESLSGSEYVIFPAGMGDIIQGYINIEHQSPYSLVICKIRNPFGNILVETETKTIEINTPHMIGEQSIQSYPWGFSFLATMDGEYTIEVKTDIIWSQLGIISIIGQALNGETTEPMNIIVRYALAVTHAD